jgi:hypothetical protein
MASFCMLGRPKELSELEARGSNRFQRSRCTVEDARAENPKYSRGSVAVGRMSFQLSVHGMA